MGRNTTMLFGAVWPPFAFPLLLQKAGQLFTWWMAPRNRRDTAFYALVFTLWTECSNIARTGTGIHLKQSTTYSFTKRNNDVVRSITCWLFTDQTLYWCSLGPAVPALFLTSLHLHAGSSWVMILPYMCLFSRWFLLGSWQLPVTPITHMDPLLVDSNFLFLIVGKILGSASSESLHVPWLQIADNIIFS